MMRHSIRRSLLRTAYLLLAASLLLPAAAYADLTAFVGANTTPSNRVVRGLAAGMTLVIVGLEFEYSSTSEDEAAAAPALRTGMGNIFVQTPIAVSGLQFYATIGAGIYRERLGAAQITHVGTNLGGGVKLLLAGPLRLRFDYRLFTLAGDPLHSRAQRVYAGLNLAF